MPDVLPWKPAERWVIGFTEMGIAISSSGVLYLVNPDSFGLKTPLLFFLIQMGISLLLLAGLRVIFPLHAGFYDAQEKRGVILRWRMEAVLLRRNLFLLHPVPYLPSILRKFVTRILGAHIGGGLISIGGPLWDPSFIHLGDEAMVGLGAILCPHEQRAESLFLGHIRIGKRGLVGARARIEGDVVIGDHAMVKAMSVVVRGTRIGPREIWAGNPAKKVGETPPTPDSSASLLMGKKDVAIKSAVQFILLALTGISMAGIYVIFPFSTLLGVVWFGLILTFWSVIAMNTIRWCYPFPPGVHPLGSRTAFVWTVYAYIGIVDLFLPYQMGFLPESGRKLLARILGAKIGRNVTLRGLMYDPFLVVLEDDVVVGKNAYLLPHAISTDSVILKEIRLGRGVTVGEESILMPGVRVGAGARVAPRSLVTMDTVIGPNETWSGVPAKKQ